MTEKDRAFDEYMSDLFSGVTVSTSTPVENYTTASVITPPTTEPEAVEPGEPITSSDNLADPIDEIETITTTSEYCPRVSVVDNPVSYLCNDYQASLLKVECDSGAVVITQLDVHDLFGNSFVILAANYDSACISNVDLRSGPIRVYISELASRLKNDFLLMPPDEQDVDEYIVNYVKPLMELYSTAWVGNSDASTRSAHNPFMGMFYRLLGLDSKRLVEYLDSIIHDQVGEYHLIEHTYSGPCVKITSDLTINFVE